MNAPYATPFAPQGAANLLPAQPQTQSQGQYAGQGPGQGQFGQATIGAQATYPGQQPGAIHPQGQSQGQGQYGQYGQGAMGAQAFYQGQQQGGGYPLPGQPAPHAYPYPGQYPAQGYGYAAQGPGPLVGGFHGPVTHPAPGYPMGVPMGMPMGTATGMPMGIPMAGYAMANVAPASADSSLLSSLTSSRFLKGLVIGGAAAYLLTNDQVQRAVIKGTVKVWTLVQGGVAELKERFQDAEAEIRAAAHPEV
jgi:hypothetical protein